jgi:hypothetical protein
MKRRPIPSPWFRAPDYEALFSGIEKVAEQYLLDVTDSVTNPENLTERIRKRRSFLSLSSDINTEVVGVCKQVLAFGAAGLALSIASGPNNNAEHQMPDDV